MASLKLVGGLAVAALVGLAAAPQAQATSYLTGTFLVSAYQGYGGGSSGSAGVQADTSNPLITSSDLVSTFTYTGAVNFNDPAGGTDTIAGFITTGGGAVTNLTGSNAYNNNTLSSGNFSATTVFVITGSVAAGVAGQITHDDGASIYQGGSQVFSQQSPTVAETANYNLNTGTFELVYVEANGLPAVLQMTGNGVVTFVPEPATIATFGIGLLGLAGMGVGAARRRA